MYLITQRGALLGCVQCKDRKPVWRVLKEVCTAWRKWGMFPFHYFRYKLYESTFEKTIPEIVDYIPEFYYDHVLVPARNDVAHRLLLRNKILSTKLLDSIDTPQPRTLFWCEGGRVLDRHCQPVGCRDMQSLLENCSRAVFAKPAGGAGGTGILVFEHAGKGVFRTSDGRMLDYEFARSLANRGDFVFQEGLEQIEEISRIFSGSINTLRIATVVRECETVLIAAILRMGRGKNRVDNSAQGGISVALDIDEWRLAETGYSEHPVASYTEHPDSGAQFGQVIPMQQEVLALLRKTAPLFANCTILGWDIALTPDGPVVVEVNPGFGIDHVQITCQRGISEDLGVVL